MIAIDEHDLRVVRKTQNYRLWRAGTYGCKLRSWTPWDWRKSGFQGQVALRTLISGGGPCCYQIEPDDVEEVLYEWEISGISEASVTVDELAPADVAILQGEYFNVRFLLDGYPTHGYLHYSRERSHMRTALTMAPERDAHGLRADLLLRDAMTQASYEDWQELLERYPEHVLEVSIYDRCLGDLPERNALVWEVRRY